MASNESFEQYRLFWLVAFGASLYFCVTFGKTMFLQWIENPITMQLTETKTLVSTIPAPTVTVCLDVKANANILNVSHVKKKLTEAPKTLSDSEYVD